MRRAVHVFSFILFFPKLFLCHSILSCSQLPWFKVSLYWTVCARCLMSKINQQLRNNFSRATLAQRQREGGVSIPARHIFPPLPPLEASSPFLINHKSSKELMSTLGLVRSEQNCDFSCSSCIFLLNSSSHLPWDFARCWAWSHRCVSHFKNPCTVKQLRAQGWMRWQEQDTNLFCQGWGWAGRSGAASCDYR